MENIEQLMLKGLGINSWIGTGAWESPCGHNTGFHQSVPDIIFLSNESS